MAIGAGITEIPDSEDEPFTSSPQVIFHDKSSPTASVASVVLQDSSTTAVCSPQAFGAEAAAEDTQRGDSLGDDVKKASANMKLHKDDETANLQPNTPVQHQVPTSTCVFLQNCNEAALLPSTISHEKSKGEADAPHQRLVQPAATEPTEYSNDKQEQPPKLSRGQNTANSRARQEGEVDATIGGKAKPPGASTDMVNSTHALASPDPSTTPQMQADGEVTEELVDNDSEKSWRGSQHYKNQMPIIQGSPPLGRARATDSVELPSVTGIGVHYLPPTPDTQMSEPGVMPATPHATDVNSSSGNKVETESSIKEEKQGDFTPMQTSGSSYSNTTEIGTSKVVQSQPHSINPFKPATGQKPPALAKTSQETTIAELKAQRAALIASLAELPNIQQLLAENQSPDADVVSQTSDAEPTDADITAAANVLVKKHIKLLHEYNEIKDVGQGLMGLIADQRGVRIVEVQEEFGIDAKD